jgi:hypothetical protein
MKLVTYLHKEERSQNWLARAVGLDHSAMSRLCRGSTKPCWKTMESLARVTGGKVMPNDFLMPGAFGKNLPEVRPESAEVGIGAMESPGGKDEAHDDAALLNAPIGTDSVLPADSSHASVGCADEGHSVHE